MIVAGYSMGGPEPHLLIGDGGLAAASRPGEVQAGGGAQAAGRPEDDPWPITTP